MQLSKQNLLQVSLSQQALTSNFVKIEQQFRRIKKQIQALNDKSKILIQKINEIDPYDFAQYAGSWDQNNEENENEAKQKQINDQKNLININKQDTNPGPNEINENLQIGDNIQNLYQNVADIKKKPTKKQMKQKSAINQTIKSKQNSHESMIKEFIKDLQVRLQSLEEQKKHKDQQIQCLDKDNQIFKRMLGIKQNKTKQKKQDPHSGNQIKVQRKKSKQIKVQQLQKINENEKFEEAVEQNNLITAFNKQFNQLKQYIKSKVVQLQSTVDKCKIQIDGQKNQINQINKQQSTIKQTINFLQSSQSKNQSQILSLLHQISSLQSVVSQKYYSSESKSQSNHNKTRNSISDQANLNDTVESYRNYYEDKIVQIFQQMDRIRSEYFNVLQKLNNEEGTTDISKLKNIAQKISVINNPNEDKLKKEINGLKKQIKKIKQQIDIFMGDINLGTGQTKTYVIKPNQNKQDWKQVSIKIYKLRQQVLSYVKDLETKINLNNDLTIVIQQLQVGLSQCKILNSKKVNFTDFQKTFKRIQNRLNNFIRQVCQKQGMVYEQEAMIAKQPWFCLSCDGQIKNFTGKLAKTMYNEKMTGKKVNPESHMIRRPQPRLPSVH